MNSQQNASGSPTEANRNNTLAALSVQWLPASDRARLVDELLRTAIDNHPPMLLNSRPASLGPLVDLSSLEYVEGYSHNLMCAICHSPFVRPLRLSCQHVFCSSCFVDARHSHEHRESCPTCRERVLPGQLYTLPKIVELILDDLIVICPFSDSGCTKQMSRCLIQDHVDKYCEYVQVSCPYDNCGEKIQRRHINQQRCLHKLMHCVTCDKSYKEIDLRSHCATHDDERIVLCPGCATTVLGSDLQSHESTCPKVSVPCIAATYGCDFMGKRASINQHNAACPLAKLVPFLAQQFSRLDQQELALQNLHRRNALMETAFDKIQSSFALSFSAEVTLDDQDLRADMTVTELASAILNMYDRNCQDPSLATRVADLDRRIETLNNAQLVIHPALRSLILHIDGRVGAVEREMARLRHELSTYRQGTRGPESAGVGALGVSEIGSSVARASEDINMVSRLIPDLGTSRPERVRTGTPVRQHMLSNH